MAEKNEQWRIHTKEGRELGVQKTNVELKS